MFKSQSKFKVIASLLPSLICASLLTFAPRPASADNRIIGKSQGNVRGYRNAPEGLRVQHIFLGKIVYGKSSVVYSPEKLEKLILRWATNEPNAVKGLCFVSRKPEIVFGNLIGSKQVALDPNTKSTLFALNLAQLTNTAQCTPGKYYFGVWPQDANNKCVGQLSNVVMVEYKLP